MSYLTEQLTTLLDGKILLILTEIEFEERVQAAIPSLMMDLDDTDDARRFQRLKSLIMKLERVAVKGDVLCGAPRVVN